MIAALQSVIKVDQKDQKRTVFPSFDFWQGWHILESQGKRLWVMDFIPSKTNSDYKSHKMLAISQGILFLSVPTIKSAW